MGYYTDQEQKKIISDNLTYYIELSGKDQKQIAIDLDINPPTFNQWVNGKAIPNVSTLKRLATYFGLTLSMLVNKPSDIEQISTLTAMEHKVVESYRIAPQGIKDSVNKLLDIEKED